jgi:hypothetical protein
MTPNVNRMYAPFCRTVPSDSISPLSIALMSVLNRFVLTMVSHVSDEYGGECPHLSCWRCLEETHRSTENSLGHSLVKCPGCAETTDHSTNDAFPTSKDADSKTYR